MRLTRLLILALAATAPTSASAQVQPGDVFFVHSQGGDPRLTATGNDGLAHFQVQDINGPSTWISGARLQDGRYVLYDNGPNASLGVYNDFGVYVSGVLLNNLPSYSSDIGAFSDDTIAVSVRDEGLRVYSLQGNLLNTLTAPGMTKPFGIQVQADDTVWVVDQQGWPLATGGRVVHIDRNSNVLHSFDIAFNPSDVATGPDGSVWVTDYTNGDVYRFQPDGTFIHSFSAQIQHSQKTLWSLAVTSDGLIWTSGHYEDRVNCFDPQGNVIQQFDLLVPGNSVFSFEGAGLSWATPGCIGDGTSGGCLCGNLSPGEEGCMNSTGRGGRLDVSGTNWVSLDDFGLLATQLPPGRPALAVVGDQTMGGSAFLGDGLRCAGGGLVHLEVQFADSSGTAVFGPNLAGIGGWAAGNTRTFQVWFRDPQGGPCGQGANTTNSQEVVFLP